MKAGETDTYTGLAARAGRCVACRRHRVRARRTGDGRVADSAVRAPDVVHAAGMVDEIAVATTDADYDVFGELIREYWEWLRTRYADLPGFIDSVGGHQALDAELNALRERYGPPAGKALLARREGEVSGAIAYRDLHDGSCEMKRMFVPDRFQRHGTGRLLCRALLDAATADGYRIMRLDTGNQNGEAIAMYTSLGFRECPPYQEYPAEILPHLRFMQKELVGEGPE